MFEHILGGGSCTVRSKLTSLNIMEGQGGAGPEGGPCTVRSNASWLMAEWDLLLWTDRYTYMTEKTDTDTWLKTLPSRNFVSGRLKFINKCFQMFHRTKSRLVFEDTNVTMSLKYVTDICFLKGLLKLVLKPPINQSIEKISWMVIS